MDYYTNQEIGILEEDKEQLTNLLNIYENHNKYIYSENNTSKDNLKKLIISNNFQDLKSLIEFSFLNYYSYNQHKLQDMIYYIDKLINLLEQKYSDTTNYNREYQPTKTAYLEDKNTLNIIDSNTQCKVANTLSTWLNKEIKVFKFKEFTLIDNLIHSSLSYYSKEESLNNETLTKREFRKKKKEIPNNLENDILFGLINYFNNHSEIKDSKRIIKIEDITLSLKQKNKGYSKINNPILNNIVQNIKNNKPTYFKTKLKYS